MRRWPLAFAALLAVVPLATACSKGGFSAGTVALTCSSPGGPVTLAVGARANSPVPVLPTGVEDLMKEAAKQSQTISIVRVDGSPTVAYQGTFRTDAANDVARNAALNDFITTTEAQVSALVPKVGEADVLSALGEAARITPEGGTVVLLDSGLQTTGAIQFQQAGMFGTDPNELVDFLKQGNLLPNLEGRSVVLVGLGNTADPQPPIDSSQRQKVTDIWQTIVQQSGASCVQVIESAASRTSVTTDVPVTVVSPPAEETFTPCGETVLRDGDTVGFVPDEAVFRDPDAARKTLQSLANLVLNGHQLIHLIGSTASAGDEQSRQELSEARANAVRDVLVQLGVSADRITTEGVGNHWSGRVPDLAPDGSLIPTAAALDRAVIVQINCPSS